MRRSVAQLKCLLLLDPLEHGIGEEGVVVGLVQDEVGRGGLAKPLKFCPVVGAHPGFHAAPEHLEGHGERLTALIIKGRVDISGKGLSGERVESGFLQPS